MNNIFIGTSGWVYPHWQGVFYLKGLPEREWLEFYAKHFSSVELNASFYHLPKEETFKNWCERTPDDFVFAVKGSRFISHVKKMKDCKEPLTNLLKAVSLLKEKLGPVFFQFSPSFRKDATRLQEFIALLPKTDKDGPCHWRFAFEFRHPSWFAEGIYTLLKQANCALVASDTPRYPYHEIQTADFMYLRLHGREQLYASSYTKEQLEEYAAKIKDWSARGGLDVYVFFDNDANANAVENAKELKRLVI